MRAVGIITLALALASCHTLRYQFVMKIFVPGTNTVHLGREWQYETMCEDARAKQGFEPSTSRLKFV